MQKPLLAVLVFDSLKAESQCHAAPMLFPCHAAQR
jgi:hypothetical protein